MINFENPIDFETYKSVKGVDIVYSDLREISQGGPVVGNIAINSQEIVGLFGGPAIYADNFVYIPQYARKFLRGGFKLVRISILDFRLEYLTKIENLIFLDRVQDNRVYYFKDLKKSIQEILDLP